MIIRVLRIKRLLLLLLILLVIVVLLIGYSEPFLKMLYLFLIRMRLINLLQFRS